MDTQQSLLCVGSFAINDVVHANGKTEINVAAGNALYSALGSRHVLSNVAVSAVVGKDWNNTAKASLESLGVDCSLVKSHEGSSLRAWVVYENSSDRRYLLRAPEIISLTPNPLGPPVRSEMRGTYESAARNLHSINCPTPEGVAPQLSQFSGIHICPMPIEIVGQWVRSIRAHSGALISLDPPPVTSRLEEFEDLLAHVDIFLPSEAEAKLMYPNLEPEAFLRRMRAIGIPQCVLKLGSEGCLGFTSQNSEIHRVSAYKKCTVRDTTGAGDVFCGAFLGSYLNSKTLREAMCSATAVASMYVEDFDPFDPHRNLQAELKNRVRLVTESV